MQNLHIRIGIVIVDSRAVGTTGVIQSHNYWGEGDDSVTWCEGNEGLKVTIPIWSRFFCGKE